VVPCAALLDADKRTHYFLRGEAPVGVAVGPPARRKRGRRVALATDADTEGDAAAAREGARLRGLSSLT
jgi:hypothetical protein